MEQDGVKVEDLLVFEYEIIDNPHIKPLLRIDFSGAVSLCRLLRLLRGLAMVTTAYGMARRIP